MNLFIITYFSYKDGLTQAYTLPYIRQLRELLPKSAKIHFTTLEQEHLKLSTSEKVEIRKELEDCGIGVSFFKWRGSGITAALSWIVRLFGLCYKILRHNYGVIHAWNTPSGVFGYILSVLTRKKLVIDSYEPHAEPMVESGTWNKNGMLFKILFLFEKLQSKRATAVIACVEKMKEYSAEKYDAQFNHFLWKPACVDLNVFDYHIYDKIVERAQLGLVKNDIVCVYAGKIGGTYLSKEIFDFFGQAVSKWGERFKVILLGNYDEISLESYQKTFNIPKGVINKFFVPHAEVPKYLSVADFAITPFVPVPSKRYGSPIKTGEYMAMGLPQIISKDISDDSDLITNENLGYVMKSWVADEFKKAFDHIESLISNEKAEKSRIRSTALTKKNFTISREVYIRYIELLSGLLEKN